MENVSAYGKLTAYGASYTPEVWHITEYTPEVCHTTGWKGVRYKTC